MIHKYKDYAKALSHFHREPRVEGPAILRQLKTGSYLVFESVEDARGHPTTKTGVVRDA